MKEEAGSAAAPAAAAAPPPPPLPPTPPPSVPSGKTAAAVPAAKAEVFARYCEQLEALESCRRSVIKGLRDEALAHSADHADAIIAAWIKRLESPACQTSPDKSMAAWYLLDAIIKSSHKECPDVPKFLAAVRPQLIRLVCSFELQEARAQTHTHTQAAARLPVKEKREQCDKLLSTWEGVIDADVVSEMRKFTLPAVPSSTDPAS